MKIKDYSMIACPREITYTASVIRTRAFTSSVDYVELEDWNAGNKKRTGLRVGFTLDCESDNTEDLFFVVEYSWFVNSDMTKLLLDLGVSLSPGIAIPLKNLIGIEVDLVVEHFDFGTDCLTMIQSIDKVEKNQEIASGFKNLPRPNNTNQLQAMMRKPKPLPKSPRQFKADLIRETTSIDIEELLNF